MIHESYSRDGRSPIPSDPMVSRRMSAVKAKDTKPEVRLRKELCKRSLRGYRLHRKDLPGRPDIVWMKKKVAVFVNGCYWHRCPYCNPSFPRKNVDFWEAKFKANRERDLRIETQLAQDGWKVVTIWECQVKKDIEICVERIWRVLAPREENED